MKLSQFYNGIGSNTNSSTTTTSPSRTQDAEFLNNSLLASDTHHNLDPQGLQFPIAFYLLIIMFVLCTIVLVLCVKKTTHIPTSL